MDERTAMAVFLAALLFGIGVFGDEGINDGMGYDGYQTIIDDRLAPWPVGTRRVILDSPNAAVPLEQSDAN